MACVKEKSKRMAEPRLRYCLEDLLKFTLECHVKGTLEIDLGLPTDFCSYLLLNHPISDTNSTQGDTLHPLYKHLSSTLYESIMSNRFSGTHSWDQSSQLVNSLEAVDFELHVREPFFTQIKDGFKTIEGRCAGGDYNRIGSGALILFNKCLVLEVKEVRSYGSFSEMLKAESLEKVLPGVKTIEEGVQVYRRFYSEDKERSSGVIAICIEKLAAQPYMYWAKFVSGLGYKGIRSLLGLNPTSSHEFSS